MQYLTVSISDLEDLVALRIRAMRPSLEAVGRFDAQRAKERFASKFDPANTYKIVAQCGLVGFYTLLDKGDHLWLDHLYIDPSQQGTGLGGKIMRVLQQLAKEKQLPLRLGALKESPANQFYLKHHFSVIEVEQWDTIYQWSPELA